MITSNNQYIDNQIDEQAKRFRFLRKQRTYLELAKTMQGADLPILQAAIDDINEELNYE